MNVTITYHKHILQKYLRNFPKKVTGKIAMAGTRETDRGRRTLAVPREESSSDGKISVLEPGLKGTGSPAACPSSTSLG